MRLEAAATVLHLDVLRSEIRFRIGLLFISISQDQQGISLITVQAGRSFSITTHEKSDLSIALENKEIGTHLQGEKSMDPFEALGVAGRTAFALSHAESDESRSSD